MANTSAETIAETIYVLHGPLPDVLAAAGTETGGPGMRGAIAQLCAETAAQFGLKTDCRQAGREDELIDLIREADACRASGIVIDAGPCANTSIALQDVLATVRIPTVHLGNGRADDSFRHHCFTAKAPLATLSGFGIDGYRLAIHGLAARTGAKA